MFTTTKITAESHHNTYMDELDDDMYVRVWGFAAMHMQSINTERSLEDGAPHVSGFAGVHIASTYNKWDGNDDAHRNDSTNPQTNNFVDSNTNDIKVAGVNDDKDNEGLPDHQQDEKVQYKKDVMCGVRYKNNIEVVYKNGEIREVMNNNYKTSLWTADASAKTNPFWIFDRTNYRSGEHPTTVYDTSAVVAVTKQ